MTFSTASSAATRSIVGFGERPDRGVELFGDLVVEQRPVGLVRVVERHRLQREQSLAVLGRATSTARNPIAATCFSPAPNTSSAPSTSTATSTMTAPTPPSSAWSGAPNSAPSRPPACCSGSSASPPGLPWPMCSKPTMAAQTRTIPSPSRRSLRDSSRFPARDEHAARGDEQRERHDHAARAEHDRRGGVDAVADRAREVRVDPERADEREDEEARSRARRWSGRRAGGTAPGATWAWPGGAARACGPRSLRLAGGFAPSRRAAPTAAAATTRRGRRAPARGCHRGTTVTPAT